MEHIGENRPRLGEIIQEQTQPVLDSHIGGPKKRGTPKGRGTGPTNVDRIGQKEVKTLRSKSRRCCKNDRPGRGCVTTRRQGIENTILEINQGRMEILLRFYLYICTIQVSTMR